MEFHTGDRAHFSFYGGCQFDLDGQIVGINDIYCVFFLPDENFVIPGAWESDPRYPNAFLTAVEHLTPIDAADGCFQFDVSELL